MKDFDKLLEEENVSLNIEKQIKRKMNKSIYSRIVSVLLCIALIGTLLYKGSSKIQEVAHYNPKDEIGFLPEDASGNEFAVLMSTYVRMYYPGLICYVNEDLVEKDFGHYEYTALLKDTFGFKTFGGKDITLKIHESQLDVEYEATADAYLTTYIEEFKIPDNENFQEIDSLSDIYKDVKDLPDSAYISASISFEDYISLEDVVKLIKEYPDANFVWLAIASETQRSLQIAEGMSLYDAFLWDFNDKALVEYPNFYIWDKDEVTAETLHQKYLSNMKLLLDHPKFMDLVVTLSSTLCPKDRLLERYEEAKNDVKGYGLRVNLEKRDLLRLMDNEDLSYVRIHDIKISKWAK